jgi:hypothetical protein
VRSFGKLADFRAVVDVVPAAKVLRPAAGSPARRYIVSDEDFFWISEPDSVMELAETLRERFSTVTVVAYLRRQDLLSVSHRKQVSGGSGMSASRFYGISATPLPEFRDYFMSYFDYAAKLTGIWAAAFGKERVRVIPFERTELVNGDVVDDFAERAGVKFTLSDPMRMNSAREGDRTLVALKLAEIDAPQWLRRKVIQALPGDGVFLPSRQEARDYLAHFAEANERLAAEWSWKGAPFRFSDSLEMYPEDGAGHWSNRNLERILDAVLMAVFSKDKKGRLKLSRDA